MLTERRMSSKYKNNLLIRGLGQLHKKHLVVLLKHIRALKPILLNGQIQDKYATDGKRL